MKELFTYWVGWEVPDSIPDAHRRLKWPRGMKCRLSGSRTGFDIWVGRVDAEGGEHAEQIVRGCYGKSGHRITMRWDPKCNPLGWRDSSERFR